VVWWQRCGRGSEFPDFWHHLNFPRCFFYANKILWTSSILACINITVCLGCCANTGSLRGVHYSNLSRFDLNTNFSQFLQPTVHIKQHDAEL
jgi:hypothetical protein